MPGTRITTIEQNGPPPADAGTLYSGRVMHARLKPFGHRFEYSVFSLLADIDRLGDLARATPLLAVNRPGLVSFRESDHVERPGETLRQFADRLLGQALPGRRAARIVLLCYPRILGYVFNPISVFFAYDGEDRPMAVLYAVRNTFGERHTYVAPILPGEMDEAGIRQTRAKVFHVSPFIGMSARYDFRLLPPGKVVRLRINETEGGEPLLAATFVGEATPLDTRHLARCLVRFPFMTFKVVAAIHWQALKIWLKGGRFHSSPPPPALSSIRDRDAIATGE